MREPYFKTITCCERCGKKSPEMEMKTDDEWKEICGTTYLPECILCNKCMKFILKKRRKNVKGKKHI